MARPTSAEEIELDTIAGAAARPVLADLERYLPASPPPNAMGLLPPGDSRVLPEAHGTTFPWADWTGKLRKPDTFESLCVSFVGLTVVDTITTARALHDDTGRELNPTMAPFAGNTAALVATKAAIDVAVIYLAKKIQRRDPKMAINLMIGANALSGIAVAQNIAVTAGR